MQNPLSFLFGMASLTDTNYFGRDSFTPPRTGPLTRCEKFGRHKGRKKRIHRAPRKCST